VLEVTACVDEPDELTSLEVYNTVWPYDAVTIDAVHSFRDSAQTESAKTAETRQRRIGKSVELLHNQRAR
jgi:hypothetical protein